MVEITKRSFVVPLAALAVALLPSTKAHARPACEEFKAFAHGKVGEPGGFNTEALVVLKGGKQVYEWYGDETRPSTPHVMWSISKVVTATITGAAVQQGKIKPDDKIARYLLPSPYASPTDLQNFRKITIRDLMAFTSGVVWQEAGTDAVQKSSIGHTLYSTGYHDVVQTYLAQPMPYIPGKVYIYSSGNANLQMAVLKKVYGKDYDKAPWDLLFRPLGLTSAHFEQDASGNYIGGSYVYLSARDMAKLGQLYLDGGVAGGKRILPTDWSRRAQTVVEPIRDFVKTPQHVVDVGLWSEIGFWLNQSVNGLPKPFPLSPEDMYFTAGRSGQLIIVIPSRKLVIARTGFDVDYWPQIDRFISLAVSCFAEGGGK